MEQKTNRLSRIDLLRGWFLVVVIVDHLGRYPGIYDAFTGRGLLWTSAAEGFFLLSGMMVGLIYGRKKLAESFASVTAKLWKRAAKLYVLCVATTMIFTFAAIHLAGRPGLKSGGVAADKFWQAFKLAMSLHYTYGWADFLQFYAVFMFLAPIAIWLFRKRLWPVVLAVSMFYWYRSGGNMYFSWQILFFGGSIYGYYMTSIEQRFKELATIKQRAMAAIILIPAGISYLASSVLLFGRLFLEGHPAVSRLLHVRPDSVQDINNWIGKYFDKAALPWPRLLVFALWFAALYLVSAYYDSWARKYLGWLLIPMGRNSLSVYIAHSFVVFSLPLILPISTNIYLNFSVVTGTILFIWAAITQRTWIVQKVLHPAIRSRLVSA